MTEPMDDERLDKIEARANAATVLPNGRPWDFHSHAHLEPHCRCMSCYQDATVWQITSMLTCDDVPGEGEHCDSADGFLFADADFVAHARQDVPALLAEVRRLRAELAARPEPIGYVRAYHDVDGLIRVTPLPARREPVNGPYDHVNEFFCALVPVDGAR